MNNDTVEKLLREILAELDDIRKRLPPPYNYDYKVNLPTDAATWPQHHVPQQFSVYSNGPNNQRGLVYSAWNAPKHNNNINDIRTLDSSILPLEEE